MPLSPLQITLLQQTLDSIKPNFSSLERWFQKDREYTKRSQELAQISQTRDSKRLEYDSLKGRRLQEFMDGFTEITMKLKEIYQMITLGGDAELEIVDSLDPFSEGIVFSVRPPKKSWKNISNLSGGEKVVTALHYELTSHMRDRTSPSVPLSPQGRGCSLSEVGVVYRMVDFFL